MTLTQLSYIVAVDTHRHFATAAESCHITQPTLSMQIQKLEDELGILIFDRSKQPVVPTESGRPVVEQAREVLRASRRIPELVRELTNDFHGELRIGIIPTLAPYLLPYFIGEFMATYPAVSVHIQELVTEQIIEQLHTGSIDVGLVVTPLLENGITEITLFREPFVVYASDSHPLSDDRLVRPEQLPTDGLWLLTEGHCFRNQVMNICGSGRQKSGDTSLLRHPIHAPTRLQYETGSLETLIKLIDRQNGFTLLPYLATLDMDAVRKNRLRFFEEPVPMREISLVMHRSFLKRQLINALQKEILTRLPDELRSAMQQGQVVKL